MSAERIGEIYSQLASLNLELEAIRKACEHKEWRIGLFMWRVGSIHPQKICTACDKPLGEPETPDEIKQAEDLTHGRYQSSQAAGTYTITTTSIKPK